MSEVRGVVGCVWEEVVDWLMEVHVCSLDFSESLGKVQTTLMRFAV